jgi:hypothetical protein
MEQAAHTGRRAERAVAMAGRTRNVLLQIALAQVGAAQAEAGASGEVCLIALTNRSNSWGLKGRATTWPAWDSPGIGPCSHRPGRTWTGSLRWEFRWMRSASGQPHKQWRRTRRNTSGAFGRWSRGCKRRGPSWRRSQGTSRRRCGLMPITGLRVGRGRHVDRPTRRCCRLRLVAEPAR